MLGFAQCIHLYLLYAEYLLDARVYIPMDQLSRTRIYWRGLVDESARETRYGPLIV